MKKTFFAIFVLLTSLPLYSLPVSNATEASYYREGLWIKNGRYDPIWYIDALSCPAFSARFGYYGDFVFDRNLEIKGDGLGRGKVIRETRMNTNAGLFVLNICDAVDLFATFGTSRMVITTSEVSWVFNGSAEGTLFTNSQFSWSVGAKAPVFHWNCLNLGVEGQYFEAYPRFIQYISSFVGDYTSFDSDNEVEYREWQIGAVVSYLWNIRCPDLAISPYIAGKWSHAQFNTHNFNFIATPSNERFTIFNLRNHKSWGFAFGATLLLYNVAGITVEGRIADELAFSVNSQFSF